MALQCIAKYRCIKVIDLDIELCNTMSSWFIHSMNRCRSLWWLSPCYNGWINLMLLDSDSVLSPARRCFSLSSCCFYLFCIRKYFVACFSWSYCNTNYFQFVCSCECVRLCVRALIHITAFILIYQCYSATISSISLFSLNASSKAVYH